MALTRRSFARFVGAGIAAASLPAAVTLPLEAKSRKVALSGPVRLNANENPYGPSAEAVRAMTAAAGLLCRYPDDSADALVRQLARLHGVSDDQILLGAGSGEILKSAPLAFTGPGQKLVMADPTFEAIGWHAAAHGTDVVKVPLTGVAEHDLAKMAAVEGAGLIYVCNPNNPTATITSKAAVRAFLDTVPLKTMVLIDEAYFHYVESSDYETMIPVVATKPNLIVIRTFSKVYGIAGLRIGYAVAQPSVIEAMAKHNVPDDVNIMGIVAASASVGDAKHVLEGRRRNHDNRAMLIDGLKALGFSTLPSEANFVMIDTRRDLKPIIEAMHAKNVEVGRVFPSMPHHMRLTVGRPEEIQEFLRVFREVMA